MAKERQTILIIEDTPANIEILSEILSDDYEVIFATNGPDGLVLAQGEKPDMVLLDVMMPDMDGYEVCVLLKGNPDTKNIPVIFVTAMGQEEDETKGLELGAIDYLTKPISPPIVKARVRNHLELKRYRDVLEELSTAATRAKKEFLRSIDHELRTPLTPILGMTDLVISTEKNSDKKKYLSLVKKSALKMLGIVEELIETSRLEADGATPDIQPFLLRPLLDSLLADFTPEAEAKGIKLIFSTPDLPSAINSDQIMLRKILVKILGNAIKFTPQGEIVLTVNKQESGAIRFLRFSVADTGVGIQEGEMERIFQDFTQADGSLSKGFTGLGLGLTLARKILAGMGGSIHAESREGQGSVFHIQIPYRTPEDPVFQ